MQHDFGEGLVDAYIHDGGGIVASTAQVDPASRIQKGSVVFGNAIVRGHCELYGESSVSGHTILNEGVILRDSKVQDYAHIAVHATIYDSEIFGDAYIGRKSRIVCGSKIFGSADIPNEMRLQGATISNSDQFRYGSAFSFDWVAYYKMGELWFRFGCEEDRLSIWTPWIITARCAEHLSQENIAPCEMYLNNLVAFLKAFPPNN